MGQKLQYQITGINDALNSNNSQTLFDGLKYCISKAKMNDKERLLYLQAANRIFTKVYNTISDVKNRESFISCGLDLISLGQGNEIKDKVDEANRLFLKSSTKDELKEAFDFYSEKCSNPDSVLISMKLPFYFTRISEKLLSADTTARKTISVDLSSISWPLIRAKEFKQSLDVIELAAKADSSNQAVYITLPLILVLNDHFDDGSSLYLKYYKKYIYNMTSMPFRNRYLADIEEFERIGITHPDFKRIREILKN